MKIGRLNRSEGPYKKGQLIAISPAPGTAGAAYVDELRYDAWNEADLLDPVEAEEDSETPESEPVSRKRKGARRG